MEEKDGRNETTEFEFEYIMWLYMRFIRMDTIPTGSYPLWITSKLDELQSGLSNPQSPRGSFEAVQLSTNEDTIGIRFHYRVTFWETFFQKLEGVNVSREEKKKITGKFKTFLDSVFRGGVSSKEIELHTTLKFFFYFCKSGEHPIWNLVNFVTFVTKCCEPLTVVLQQDRNRPGSWDVVRWGQLQVILSVMRRECKWKGKIDLQVLAF